MRGDGCSYPWFVTHGRGVGLPTVADGSPGAHDADLDPRSGASRRGDRGNLVGRAAPRTTIGGGQRFRPGPVHPPGRPAATPPSVPESPPQAPNMAQSPRCAVGTRRCPGTAPVSGHRFRRDFALAMGPRWCDVHIILGRSSAPAGRLPGESVRCPRARRGLCTPMMLLGAADVHGDLPGRARSAAVARPGGRARRRPTRAEPPLGAPADRALVTGPRPPAVRCQVRRAVTVRDAPLDPPPPPTRSLRGVLADAVRPVPG